MSVSNNARMIPTIVKKFMFLYVVPVDSRAFANIKRIPILHFADCVHFRSRVAFGKMGIMMKKAIQQTCM